MYWRKNCGIEKEERNRLYKRTLQLVKYVFILASLCSPAVISVKAENFLRCFCMNYFRCDHLFSFFPFSVLSHASSAFFTLKFSKQDMAILIYIEHRNTELAECHFLATIIYKVVARFLMHNKK